MSLPSEDFVYLGDTARFPYGIKPAAELRERAEAVTRFLLDRGAKLLVIACNSATTAARAAVADLAAEQDVPVVSVIDPEAEIASAISPSGRVGVLATPTTVEGGSYLRALERTGRELEVTQVAAPDLAPIIQNGFPFDDGVVETTREYVEPLKEAEVDTLILGCTHYPLVAPMLQRMLGRDVRLVTAGHAVAANVQRVMEDRGLTTGSREEGTYSFLCTADVDSFRELGTRFLQMPLGEVEHVEID